MAKDVEDKLKRRKIMEKELNVHVLFRFSKKTGKIDKVMTGLGSAMMKLWALENTTKTKACIICERNSGNVVMVTEGNANGFPKVIDKNLGTIDEYGIPLKVVQQEIVDDRFD